MLFVDFLSGLVHWVEDTFWIESTPILGAWIVKPNVLHHDDASAFVQNSWFQSSWDLLVAGLAVLVAAWFFHLLTWQIWLFVIVGVNANQIHKWNHMPAKNVPRWIRALQHIRLLQSPAHHARHHQRDKNSYYCVITEVMNPILERIGFWPALERFVVPLFRAPRRKDLCLDAD